ncbi:ECs1072 family phage-associated protein, partial [Mangrovibacter plantisponsor]
HPPSVGLKIWYRQRFYTAFAFLRSGLGSWINTRLLRPEKAAGSQGWLCLLLSTSGEVVSWLLSHIQEGTNMNGYENLYLAILPDLAEHYGISSSHFQSNPHSTSSQQCRSHLYKLILIEFYLHEHRLKNSKSVLHLDGVAALHHLVYLKTKWTPASIRNLNTPDLLFALLDDLVPDQLSETAQNYLAVISKNQRLPKIDLMSYTGWEIGSGGQYLKDE